MASEPTEDAIANFVSFTSTTREQAVNFLKANNLDSQKAINAYFEELAGPQPKADNYYNDKRASSWDFTQQDNAPPIPATAPPSRPPSRMNMNDTDKKTAPGATAPQAGTGQGLSLAEREEKELQQAVAMSLNSGLGQQEIGVTSSSQPQFSKATRDHYEEGDWAMTLFNTSSEEVTIGPEPEDRRRGEGEPAFIRPTQDGLYLGGFLTIIHEIPLAREALLLRNKPLFDYGHEPHWWNGQSINLPKIVTVNDSNRDADWDDVIHEAQRLMAFMDSTKRSFGSSDSLARIRSLSMFSSDSEEIVTRFLEAWHGAAIRADPDNQLAAIFTSHAYKQQSHDYDEPVTKDLFTFEIPVEPDHGQSLYEVIDRALWNEGPEEELENIWIESIAEVLCIKLDCLQRPNPVDVKIPPVFYPDRYLSSCRDLARELRLKRQQIQGDIWNLEKLIRHYTFPRNPVGKLTVKELLERAAEAAPVVVPEKPDNADSSSEATVNVKQVAEQLRAIAAKIEEKIQELEVSKENAVKSLREISKTLTEPSESPSEPPTYKYTLRGVCTQPHITYVLSNAKAGSPDLMDMEDESGDQWWRISYSTEDGKTRQAEKRKAQGDNTTTQNGDVVGYSASKVREDEVLQAARDEWRSVLLVYASENAMKAPVDPAPAQLRGFVNRDNAAFEAEFDQTATIINSDQEESWAPTSSTETQQSEQPEMTEKRQQVNVFDYEVSGFDDEPGPRQEMQQRDGGSLLSKGTANNSPPKTLQVESEGKSSHDEEMVDHAEHV
ncbi:uncharacterized protein N7446_009656 [Penicillium canescens]|uniref:Ubiquitin interaction motif protein n=1 Tax=Penicillium canescens TaxID=5083 RepID=A0AAD6N667_PENCN|nr:uncharacterized protein N7446_009656 [Penicillium canescens]KAJ6034899.1 hypothetical protein N7460_009074 [Penicillium canescens]KAJ6046562.1 hypothetical protein N7444_007816 [Penicillium canescens]KAJ6053644.1 hypothetical protein N7446_009656 [Penicillium canescens]